MISVKGGFEARQCDAMARRAATMPPSSIGRSGRTMEPGLRRARDVVAIFFFPSEVLFGTIACGMGSQAARRSDDPLGVLARACGRCVRRSRANPHRA